MLNIEDNKPTPSFALFELGFRPFFSAAGIFAVISMLLWMAIYVAGIPLVTAQLSPILWHAHEMVFGYAMAVIAGFLLTAVGNWTGQSSFKGGTLGIMLTLWLIARVSYFLPIASALTLAAIADLLFMLGLIIGVSLPVVRAKQWKQIGIIAKLWLMLVANGVFYMGTMGHLESGIFWGLYSGFYLVLGLIFMMARRVIPFFIEKGVDEHFTPRNRRWIDISSLFVFLLWAILEIFTQQAELVALLSIGLFSIHLIRLYDWHGTGIWKKPLLWSLYLGYAFLNLGFLLKALSFWLGVSPYLAIHAFALGGIGIITIGMMSRVSLGHTGRNVFNPPKILAPIFLLMLAGAVIRVILPMIDHSHYMLWIMTSQVLWILGFSIFSATYVPMLLKPRIDGRPG